MAIVYIMHYTAVLALFKETTHTMKELVVLCTV